jgi:hypothetical protein
LCPAQETRHFVQRPLGCGQSDALEGLTKAGLYVPPQLLQALEREGEVRAAFAGDQRVDFIDDHRVDGPQPLTGVRRQQQKERLRRGDEDVGRLAQEARAFVRRRVARPDGDLRRVDGDVLRVREVRDAGQRRAQVALDVDGQGLQRRDVEDAAALLPRRHRREHQPVEAPQKRGQRLAAAGRRKDERRLAAGNRRPPELLWCGRRGECAAEP